MFLKLDGSKFELPDRPTCFMRSEAMRALVITAEKDIVFLALGVSADK